MPETKKEKKYTLYVMPKNDNNRLHALQAIVYTDGSCSVGIDCWRNLDTHDTASHSVTEYATKEHLFHDYDIMKGKWKNKTKNTSRKELYALQLQ